MQGKYDSPLMTLPIYFIDSNHTTTRLLILPRRVQLNLAHNVINLLQNLGCKFIQNRQCLAVLDNLLGPRRARDNG
jgi:hypothetical protein